jgi:predicted cupin superfamily sugar epimerase
MSTAADIIARLGLAPLPHEGGFFRQTWRTPAGSAILYLMTPESFSALHRLCADEVWHFHAGDPVEHVQLDQRDSSVRRTRLGANIAAGDTPQVVVPAGVWQGARVATAGGAGWSLLGCTMVPAWDEKDFELGVPDSLLRAFPAEAALVRALTR